MAICGQCGGVGTLQGDYPACPQCNGRGDNGMDRRIPCQSCRGSGRASVRRTDTCWCCGGRGRVDDPAPKPVPTKTPAKTATAKPRKGGTLDGIGKVMALAAAVGAGVWMKGRAPDEVASWFIAAGVAGALTYALRKFLIVGAAVVGGIYALAANKGGDDPPAAPARSAAIAATGQARLVGLCIVNDTSRDAHYKVAPEGGPQDDTNRLGPGQRTHHWAWADDFRKVPAIAVIDIDGALNIFDAPLGGYDADKQTGADTIRCGVNGLPEYVIRDGTAGAELWTR